MPNNSSIGFKQIKENNVNGNEEKSSQRRWPNGMWFERSAVQNQKHCCERNETDKNIQQKDSPSWQIPLI